MKLLQLFQVLSPMHLHLVQALLLSYNKVNCEPNEPFFVLKEKLLIKVKLIDCFFFQKKKDEWLDFKLFFYIVKNKDID